MSHPTPFHLIRWRRDYRLHADQPRAGRPVAHPVAAFATRADAEAAVASTDAQPDDFFTIDLSATPRFPFGTQYSSRTADYLGPKARFFGPWDERTAIERCYAVVLRQPRARVREMAA